MLSAIYTEPQWKLESLIVSAMLTPSCLRLREV